MAALAKNSHIRVVSISRKTLTYPRLSNQSQSV